MRADYDAKIAAHYDQVAADCGLSPHSTMADEIIREKETAVIVAFVEHALRECAAQAVAADRPARPGAVTVLDVGCGNGYTLKTLANALPAGSYLGIEQNSKLRELAQQQVAEHGNVRVLPGDLRARASLELPDESVDILICQRVLINLLSEADSRSALDNIVALVRPQGRLLFIESFTAALLRLNEARAEFGLAPIPPAHHNKYLEEDFFAHPRLQPCASEPPAPRNALSTHYYVTRVLHSALSNAVHGEFKRNSHFVKFLSSALPEGVGDYAPLQFHFFVKRSSDLAVGLRKA
jgi:SAM-dependent methyltransferase